MHSDCMSRLMALNGFSPEDISVISVAFEDALKTLGLVDRTDPRTELIARAIIECTQMGERDPIRLRDGALKSL
jgi:hypothetical protein